MKVTLEIKRQRPDGDAGQYTQTFDVNVEGTDRVLDALMEISRNEDGSLAFRRSCAHGVCGSDAMRINGEEKLACKALFKDIVEGEGETVRIEPLRHLEVQKDLMVDQSPFFEKFKSVKPYLIPKEEPEEGPLLG